MSAHDCKVYTPGCFRCDLNLDELDEEQLRESLRAARAEVAALREECEMLRSELEDGMGRTWREDRDKARRDLAEARRLLERWHDWWAEYGRGSEPEVEEDTRAFLDQRRAAECDCYQSGDTTHARDCPARDEARGVPECTHPFGTGDDQGRWRCSVCGRWCDPRRPPYARAAPTEPAKGEKEVP